MDTFALIPFLLNDRVTFPGNPINIFAVPAARARQLDEQCRVVLEQT
jgi:hypothetical protein